MPYYYRNHLLKAYEELLMIKLYSNKGMAAEALATK